MANLPVLVSKIPANPGAVQAALTINSITPTYNVTSSSILSATTVTSFRYASDAIPLLVVENNLGVSSNIPVNYPVYVNQVAAYPSVATFVMYRYTSDPIPLKVDKYNLGVSSNIPVNYPVYVNVNIPNSGTIVTSKPPDKTIYNNIWYANNSPTRAQLSVSSKFLQGANIANSSYVVVTSKSFAVQSYDTANGSPIVDFYIANTRPNPSVSSVLSLSTNVKNEDPLEQTFNQSTVGQSFVTTAVQDYNPKTLPLLYNYDPVMTVATNIQTGITQSPQMLQNPTGVSFVTTAVQDYNPKTLPLLYNYDPVMMSTTTTQLYSLLSSMSSPSGVSFITSYYGTGGNFDPNSPFLGGTTAYWS